MKIHKDFTHVFVVRYRCDQEEYYCTDTVEIESFCTSIIDFCKNEEHYKQDLLWITNNNTIISIEMIVM